LGVVGRIISTVASSRYARKLVGVSLSLTCAVSSRLRWDPIVQVQLGPLGVDARFAFHLLNRDLSNLVEIFVNHVYDKYCPINNGDLVIDCGAYVGEFTVQAARKVGGEGLVLAFEPNPLSFPLCKANIERNSLKNVRLFSNALGETDGRAHFQVDSVNLGASKVIPAKDQGPTSGVSVMTLSQFIGYFDHRTVKLLKIDVEGFAMKIASGATDLFARKLVQNVSAEIHPGEEGLQEFLESYGFRCSREENYLYATL